MTNIGAIVPLLMGGIGRRKNAVVQRAGFTDQAEPFALGLWDKLDNFTHVCLLKNVPHFLRRLPGTWGEERALSGREIGRNPSKSVPIRLK